MTHKLTDIEKGVMVERIDNGITYREAARQYGIHHMTAARVYRQIKAAGMILRKEDSGAPKKWSYREARILQKRLIYSGQAMTAVDVKRIPKNDICTHCS